MNGFFEITKEKEAENLQRVGSDGLPIGERRQSNES